MNEINFVGDLQRVDVKPGDRFVITCDEHLSPERMNAVGEAWRRFVGEGGPPVLVLPKGFKVGVLGAEAVT